MPKTKYPIFKCLHSGEKGFTLIELLIVVAILGIIAAVIIPNIAGFMATGYQAAANSEAETVKTAALGYFADNQDWPATSADLVAGNYTAGTLKASYHFSADGFLDGVDNPGAIPDAEDGSTSTAYDGIEWLNPTAPDVGHGKWVRS